MNAISRNLITNEGNIGRHLMHSGFHISGYTPIKLQPAGVPPYIMQLLREGKESTRSMQVAEYKRVPTSRVTIQG